MIVDNQTNKLYLSDCLPNQYPMFFESFKMVLKTNNIDFDYLPGTKDIWAIDFMPVQVHDKKFVRFTYNPSYLQAKKYRSTISNTDAICDKLEIETIKSDIVLDGGNVTKCQNSVMLTDRIFDENPNYQPNKLIKALESLFEVDKVFLIPQQPHDFTGHSDGMVRFVDERTLLINDYKLEDKSFRRAFYIAIHNAGFDCIEIPYNPYSNSSYTQANGDYINFLQMEKILFLPVFGIAEDDQVVKTFEAIYPNEKIVPIESNEIANQGGVLNCITWNIKS